MLRNRSLLIVAAATFVSAAVAAIVFGWLVDSPGVIADPSDTKLVALGDEVYQTHCANCHGLEVGPDKLAVGLQPRQRARPRAGRQYNVLRGEVSYGLAILRDSDLSRAGQLRLTVYYRHFVLLQEVPDTTVELF